MRLVLDMDASRMTRKILLNDINNDLTFSSNVKSICDDCNMLSDYDQQSKIDISNDHKCLMKNYEITW